MNGRPYGALPTLAAALVLLAACGLGSDPDDPALRFVPGSRLTGEVASLDGVPIAYEVDGVGRTAVVFIHGWAGDRGYWSNQMEAFIAEYRVVALDLGGHGTSGRHRDDWEYGMFGEDVRAVVEALDLSRVILVGHSLGGIVALEAARRMPERVIGVVGVDTLHDAEATLDTSVWAPWLDRFEEDFHGACASFVAGMFHESTGRDLVRRVTADMCAEPPDITVTLLRRYLEYDLAATLGDVKVPVRCINAAPTEIETNRRYAADFDVVLMENVGHFPMLERPDAFNRILARVLRDLSRERGAAR